MDNSIVIVTPTYNEAQSLPILVKQISDLGLSNWQLIVVDDNSPDNTGKIADELAKKYPLNVIHRPGKLGFGPAYQAGFSAALSKNPDYIVQMDADLSHQPSDLPRLLEAAKQSDMVIGSRYVRGGGNKNWSWFRQFISGTANRIVRVLLRSNIHDMTSGFRVFSRQTLQSIDFSKISSLGYSFQIEVLASCEQKKLRITEVPIIFVEREHGKSKFNMPIILECARRVLRMSLKSKNGK